MKQTLLFLEDDVRELCQVKGQRMQVAPETRVPLLGSLGLRPPCRAVTLLRTPGSRAPLLIDCFMSMSNAESVPPNKDIPSYKRTRGCPLLATQRHCGTFEITASFKGVNSE